MFKIFRNDIFKRRPERQVKISDHKSADHYPNLVLGAKN
jgi:hypothetical protein